MDQMRRHFTLLSFIVSIHKPDKVSSQNHKIKLCQLRWCLDNVRFGRKKITRVGTDGSRYSVLEIESRETSKTSGIESLNNAEESNGTPRRFSVCQPISDVDYILDVFVKEILCCSCLIQIQIINQLSLYKIFSK